LIIAFILTFSAWIIQGAFLPKLSIFAFLPFLSLLALKTNLIRLLWGAFLVGFFVDLLSDDPMGLHALNYVLTSAFLWKIHKAFDADEPLHLSLLTLIGSSLSTALQLTLLFLFDRRIPFDGRWIVTDLIGMPVIDAVYAFVWIAAPLTLCKHILRLWMIFWLKRKNSPSPKSP
jgi:cell shape-determining protein MreD